MATSETLPHATEPSRPSRPQLIVEPVPPVDSEQRRWLRLLGLDFVAGCAFFLTLFGTGIPWFVLGVLLCWPFAGIASLVYLAISSDTNGSRGAPSSPQTRVGRSHAREPVSASPLRLPASPVEASD